MHRPSVAQRNQVWCIVLQPWTTGKKPEGQLHVKLTYKPFEDDESNSSYREAEAYALMLQEQAITDIKSAAGDPPSRAASIRPLKRFAYNPGMLLSQIRQQTRSG